MQLSIPEPIESPDVMSTGTHAPAHLLRSSQDFARFVLYPVVMPHRFGNRWIRISTSAKQSVLTFLLPPGGISLLEEALPLGACLATS
jgi:hypothetical protein